ncbi:MAG: secondary thiamine-phosphate synthase enzyme YjbQ [Tepidisphaeraceae bacterium]|jgi:secondary thiamine-phosphate synthase enzyme
MKSIPAQVHAVQTHTRSEMLDVTRLVTDRIREAKIRDGLAIIYVPHTTAAVTINENADPDVQHDLLQKLDALIPRNEKYYQHAEGNSDSHLKTSLTGSSVQVLIESGRLILGQWQGIYLCEFDGPRPRNLIIKLLDFTPTTI